MFDTVFSLFKNKRSPNNWLNSEQSSSLTATIHPIQSLLSPGSTFYNPFTFFKMKCARKWISIWTLIWRVNRYICHSVDVLHCWTRFICTEQWAIADWTDVSLQVVFAIACQCVRECKQSTHPVFFGGDDASSVEYVTIPWGWFYAMIHSIINTCTHLTVLVHECYSAAASFFVQIDIR